MIDFKIILAWISTAGGFLLFFPYIRDTVAHSTKPHVYTWLIWTLTQGGASLIMISGGAGIGALGFVVSTVMCGVVFVLSIFHGTKNITWIDTAMLVLAFGGLILWYVSRNPFLTVIVATVTDIIGYGPSLRKSFVEPWSETVVTWIGFSVVGFIAIAALREYNALTLVYVISITAANIEIAALCLLRRRSVARPVLSQGH